MRRASNKGRGPGRGAAAGAPVAGRGRGRSVPAIGTSETPSSGASRGQNLQRYMVGPNAALRMVRPEQVQAIVDWVADSGSSSFTLSPTQSPAERPQLAPAADVHQSFTSPPCKSAKQSEPQVMQQSLLLFDDSVSRVLQLLQ